MPEIQEIIFESLSGFDCNVILEKPLATSYQSWRNVSTQIKNAKCRVFYSQPWTFSKLWQRFLSKASELSSPISIEIQRSGQSYRNEFSALQDWLPHDLYLLESFLRKLEVSGEPVIVTEYQGATQTLIDIGRKVFISVSFIESEERKMFWTVSDVQGNTFKIDFFGDSITQFNKESMLFSETFPNDQPLLNMIQQCKTDIQERHNNDLPIMQEITARNFQSCDLRFI